MNLQETLQKLRSLDELTILELLELKTDDLVDAFLDKIEENYNRVTRYISDNE